MNDPNTKQNDWGLFQLLKNALKDALSSSSRFGPALIFLIIFALFGFVFIILYAVQMDSLRDICSVIGASALVGGASFLIGGLLGFLFGVPKTVKLQDQSEGAQ